LCFDNYIEGPYVFLKNVRALLFFFFMTISSLYALIRSLLNDCAWADEAEKRALQRRILAAMAGVSYQDVVMNPSKEVDVCVDDVRLVIDRIGRHEPVEYVFNSAMFHDLELSTNGNVLIPRPETEELADLALDYLRGCGHVCNVLDIGTGSGCIPVYLAHNMPENRYFAFDISENAIATASQNAARYACDISFERVDILDWRNSEALRHDSDTRFDVIISNPPYVMDSEKSLMQANVLDYEPHNALFVPDSDPLLFYREISEFAAHRLVPGGRLFFEINEQLAKETAALMESRGFRDIEIVRDLFSKDRFVIGTSISI